MKSNDITQNMRRKAIKILFITLLMAMVGVNTVYADEKDMGNWSNNPDFGQNGANLTADGYSLL